MLLDRFSLDGRVAVVTGAGRGNDLRALGRQALVFPADVSDLSTLDRVPTTLRGV